MNEKYYENLEKAFRQQQTILKNNYRALADRIFENNAQIISQLESLQILKIEPIINNDMFLPLYELNERIVNQLNSIYDIANSATFFQIPEIELPFKIEELSNKIDSILDECDDISIPEEIVPKETLQNKEKLTKGDIIGIIGLLLMIWFHYEEMYFNSQNTENKELQIKMQELIDITEGIYQAIENQDNATLTDNGSESTQNESNQISNKDNP